MPLLTGQSASAQEEMEDIRDSTNPEDIAIREQVSDMLTYGFSESEERQWKIWHHDHPGETQDDFKEYWGKIEVAAQGLQQLSANHAGGWAFIAPSSSWRGTPVIVNPEGGDKPTKFVLASLRIPTILRLTDSTNPSTTRRNVIRVREAEDPWRPLPSRFFEVNDRFLADMQSLTDAARASREHRSNKPESMAVPHLKDSAIAVITGTKSDGREMLTLFALSDSARTGALIGDTYSISPQHNWRYFPSSVEEPFPLRSPTPTPTPPMPVSNVFSLGTLQELLQPIPIEEIASNRFAESHIKRIYYYGDVLEHVDIAQIAKRLNAELIHRDIDDVRDLLHTDIRLNKLSERSFEKDKLTIVDGLPRNRAAVMEMGPFVADPSAWANFRTQVEGLLRTRTSAVQTRTNDFLRELESGDSDMIILIAHSTGTYLYLNGGKISIRDLMRLKPRASPSSRPRLAVLVVCDAGRLHNQGGRENWIPFLRDKVEPLARILVNKGFVDKVIAPDHAIQQDESLTVLRRALNGARTNTLFEGWANWATRWALVLEQSEKPS